MSEQGAEAYHREQAETFAGTAADMMCAITMNYLEEAVDIARAAQRVDMPVAISFTVETDGKLPTGQTLKAAIERVDEATSGYPPYYMINCAHPTSPSGQRGEWASVDRGAEPLGGAARHRRCVQRWLQIAHRM